MASGTSDSGATELSLQNFHLPNYTFRSTTISFTAAVLTDWECVLGCAVDTKHMIMMVRCGMFQIPLHNSMALDAM